MSATVTTSTFFNDLNINMEPNRIHYRHRLTQDVAKPQWESDITDVITVLEKLHSGFNRWWDTTPDGDNAIWTIKPPGSKTTITFSPTSGDRTTDQNGTTAKPWNKYSSDPTALSSWRIGVTQYGVLMSQTISQLPNETNILENKNIVIYFTVLQNIFNPNDKIPAMFYAMYQSGGALTDLDTQNNAQKRFLIEYGNTEPESVDLSFFNSQRYPQLYPVLTNMCCKDQLYFAPYLYIKETNSNDCYGKILLEETVFLAGSFYCLAAGSREDVDYIQTNWRNRQNNQNNNS